MARNNGRTVYLRSDGRWANKGNDSLFASGFYDTQAEACAEAIRMLQADGGGQLTVKDEAGQAERRPIASAAAAPDATKL